MKKYWITFKNNFQVSLTYRFNTAAAFVAEMLSLLIMAYLWLSIYRQGNTIGGYTLSGLLAYYVTTQFISLTIRGQDVARAVGEIIRQGELNAFLLKPTSFLLTNLSNSLSTLSYNLIIYVLAFAPIVVLWPQLIVLKLSTLSLFFLFVLLGFLINFLFFYLVGLSTFYLGFIMGLNYILLTITSFLGGQMLPLDLLPASLSQLVSWLPFQFIAFVPIKAVNGQLGAEELLTKFVLGLSWVALLAGLTVFVYKKGLKKYEAYSG